MRAEPTRTRREFLLHSGRAFGAAWIAASLPALAVMSGCARESARLGEPFRFFSAAEARAFAAFASEVLPSDDLPGAEEAGAVYFADQGLTGPFAEAADLVRAGLADLDHRAALADPPPPGGFAALDSPARQAVMREIEETEFFSMAWLLTVMGVFADPSHGGNAGNAGATILGMEPHGAHQPPFGWYDAEHAKGGGGS
jgi:hypothetical protein